MGPEEMTAQAKVAQKGSLARISIAPFCLNKDAWLPCLVQSRIGKIPFCVLQELPSVEQEAIHSCGLPPFFAVLPNNGQQERQVDFRRAQFIARERRVQGVDDGYDGCREKSVA